MGDINVPTFTKIPRNIIVVVVGLSKIEDMLFDSIIIYLIKEPFILSLLAIK